MREKAVTFGSHRGLAGVLCEPEAGCAKGVPAFLFANVGINHHVGPNRYWVELARVLAEKGYPSLRFDLSGFGDSQNRQGTQTDLERAKTDMIEAFQWLEDRAVAQKFVLVANCSGVDSLHAVACIDSRVVGAVSIDGYAYRNIGVRLLRPKRLLEIARWQRRLRLRKAQLITSPGAPEPVVGVWKREYPSQAKFAQDLKLLVNRNVKLLFVFTSGMDSLYGYEDQFYDMFGFRKVIEIAFFNRADHLISTMADRQALTQRICDWAQRMFPICNT